MVDIKKNKSDKILNPKTGRYVSINSVIGKKLLKEPKKTTIKTKKEPKKEPKKELKKELKEGYEYVNGKIYKKCEHGKIRNPITNRCIKIKNDKKDKNEKIIKSKSKSKSITKAPVKRFTTYMNYPLNYKFNKSNVEKFLNACDNATRPIAKKIIDNTRHVSFEEMIKNLNKNIKELNEIVNKDRPIFIFVNVSYKEKSNYWIYLYLKDYIEHKYPYREIILLSNIIIDNEKIKDNDIIVFIDDCIYTGSQMRQNISSLYNKNLLKLNIYILTSFISRNGEKLIKSITKFNIIFNKYIEYIPIINDYVNNDELHLLEEYYSSIDKYDYKNNYLQEEFFNKYLIYFDHKLADTVSTIPLFYSGVVPNDYNRNLFNNSVYVPKNLQIIPLFLNCENIRNIDVMKPECPSTPYKKYDNKEFMKKINKKKKALSNPY